MSFKVSEFSAQIDASNGFLRTNKFELAIPQMPKWSAGKYDGSIIPILCNSASLPGANIDTIDVRKTGIGLLEYFPTNVSFYDLRTTFYADGVGGIVKFFNEWIQNIVEFQETSQKSTSRFRVAYRDKYVSQVMVTQFDDQGERVLRYKYIDAFPVAIEPLGVRWFGKDEIHEFSVIWKYLNWTEESGEASRYATPSENESLTVSQSTPVTGFPGFPEYPEFTS